MTGDVSVLHVDAWPAGHDRVVRAQKNPTLIAYLPKIRPIPWGYQIEAQNNICAWMKYHLDKNSPPTKHDDPRLLEAIRSGLFCIEGQKSPEDVATDYLKEVFKFSIDYLKKLFTKEDYHLNGEELLRVTPIEWWLVRPAIWSNQAVLRLQNIVQDAVRKADFYRPQDKFKFVTEADAASFTVLYEAAAQDELAVG